MNHLKVFLWSLTVALAGFLFGFDTVVISGAEKPFRHSGRVAIVFMAM